jgi:hypothetical protein
MDRGATPGSISDLPGVGGTTPCLVLAKPKARLLLKLAEIHDSLRRHAALKRR